MKTHLNLGTTSIENSVQFYSALLDTKPAKVLPDYALFVTDEPGLELALDLRSSDVVIDDSHYGIFVETAAEVESAISRLEAAGLVSSIEREETCCYANQTKVWTVDPEGRRWEIYTVHEDTQEKIDAGSTCCAADDTERSCCAA